MFLYNHRPTEEDQKLFEEDLKNYETPCSSVYNSLDEIQEEKGLIKKQDKKDLFIIPSFQTAIIDYDGDKQFYNTFLSNIKNFCYKNQENFLTFASGYFNPSHDIRKVYREFPEYLIKKSICASPLSNAFYNSGYIKGFIPRLYRYCLLKLIEEFKNQKNWEYYEYYKKGINFHAKGLWFCHEFKHQEKEQHFKEYITICGSSNYGARSYARDQESQFTLFTTSDKLIKRLENERISMFDHSTQITTEKIISSEKVPISLLVKFIYKFGFNFL